MTGGCEANLINSALAVQQAMLPYLSASAELRVSRERSPHTTVAVAVRGGPADVNVLAAISSLGNNDVAFTSASVIPETGERWSFDARRGDDAVVWLEALLAAGVVPLEVSNSSGFVPVFIQVNPGDLEAALSAPVPPGVRAATITDLDLSDWYASPQPSPSS